MLNKGSRHREQILSPAAVELTTSDQLTPEQRAGSEIFFGDFSSWGLGMVVDIQRREIFHTPGRYGWTGGFGTTAYNDPQQGMIGILFTQRMMRSPGTAQSIHRLLDTSLRSNGVVLSNASATPTRCDSPTLPLLPARKYLVFSSLRGIGACKIFITNELRPKYCIEKS
jgi:CubicO group peptidase (beta-lactamase class C family)